MRDDAPSRTAAAVAFRRAAHQVLDDPLVFHDPLARRMLSAEANALLDTDPRRGRSGPFDTFLRAFLAVRSRVAEDQLARAVAAGVQQYIVLGAGLDTFACRNPYPELRVFEVDHPRTQQWKRERLRAAGLTASEGTRFVPVDFESQTVAHELGAHGFDPNRSTAISWLGVVPYLERETVWSTLEWAHQVIGSAGHVVFDYGSEPRWWQLGQRLALRRLARRVAAIGEPFRTRLVPADAQRRLRTLGFGTVTDLDSSALTSRYFSGRRDGLRVAGNVHVVIAARART